MNMMVEGLTDAWHEVKVIAINSFKYHVKPEDIPSVYRMKTRIELIDLDLRIRPLPALFCLLSGKSYHIRRFISPGLKTRLEEILREEEFDIIQLETLYVCPYLDTIREHSHAKVVLRAHNIEHLIWSRIAGNTGNPLKQWYLKRLARSLKKYEIETAGKVDGIAAITGKDASEIRRLSAGRLTPETPDSMSESCRKIIDIPFGVDISRYPVPVKEPDRVTLFTIGAMNWIPNIEGVRWFLEYVWPEVHSQLPGLTYHLAGREMPDWLLRLRMPGVAVEGEVENAIDFISSHSVMIVPLFSGSGIRIKIIEGMALGRTVISTLTGAEGIDYTHGKNILIANAPCEFTDMIVHCVQDRERCLTIGRQARTLIEERYDRDHVIGNLTRFYQDLRL
jgi:glycosyltransferase involved in cell wall biosynthesis